ncbi:MAG: Methyltransferase-related protein [uncultured Sulfurovum sp.]|uniref:Methyltransferase-related protein n=1 Tax=uncultured Sulfurovum sp. TaxID=269237 RepID=A0A6S6UF70_9BACT|nr:MAG: Methyltransferase-related protein [uncultured Sulfurovum sp.]
MDCHICTKETQSFVDSKTNITYYSCAECEYIFKSPQKYQSLTKQKERYDLHTNSEEDQGYIAYFQRFLDFLLPQISDVKSALDFGCGKSTILATMLEKEGISCDYYDPIYHPDTLEANKVYDLIVSTEVFEHLSQPKEVFASLVKRLKKGGYLAIQTQFHSNSIETFKMWYYHQDPTHIVFFRPKTFEILAKMYGCRICSTNDKNMVLIEKI